MKQTSSMTTRIIAVVTLSFLILLSLVSYSHYYSMREFTKESESQKSELILQSIAPVVSIDMYLDMDDPMRDYLMKIVEQNPLILKLTVRDEKGRTRFDYSSAGSIFRKESEPIVRSIQLRNRMNGSNIGEIEMHYSDAKYEMLLSRYRLFTILLFAGAMLLALVLLLWLRSYLSPLKKLAEELKSYDPRRQNFIKERMEGRDEITVIHNAVVDMVEKIENYTSKLFELNLQLETKVKERTRILEQTNEQLRKEVVERTRAEEALKYANKMLEQLSTTDALTGLYNRRMFDQNLANYWKMARREQMPISLLLCDIDFFKQINDRFGHLEGDRCLKELAQILKACISRPMDMVARYGGEEFIFVLPDTPLLGAVGIANDIMQRIAKRNEATYTEIKFTLSIGVATVTPNEKSGECIELLHAADEALYAAKEKGRNRIEVHPL